MSNPPTSTQPQVTDQRIYGSTQVEPLEGASNQPQVIPTKSYSKTIPTIRVGMKDDGNKELVINADAYDPDIHEKLD